MNQKDMSIRNDKFKLVDPIRLILAQNLFIQVSKQFDFIGSDFKWYCLFELKKRQIKYDVSKCFMTEHKTFSENYKIFFKPTRRFCPGNDLTGCFEIYGWLIKFCFPESSVEAYVTFQKQRNAVTRMAASLSNVVICLQHLRVDFPDIKIFMQRRFCFDMIIKAD